MQRIDYYPFGSISAGWSSSTTPAQPTIRYRFSGKEIAGQKVGASAPAGTPAAAVGNPYLDFGARLYDPRTASWLSHDPLAEKYYGISPLAYCFNNPIIVYDPDGRDGYVSNTGNYQWFWNMVTESFSDISGNSWTWVTNNKEKWDEAITIREANIEALVSLSYDRDDVSKDVQLYSGDSPLFTKESFLQNAESYTKNWATAFNSATGRIDSFVSGEIGNSGLQLIFYPEKGGQIEANSLGLVKTGIVLHPLEGFVEMLERIVFRDKADNDPLYDMHKNNAKQFLKWIKRSQ